jgi:hypothetical protein
MKSIVNFLKQYILQQEAVFALSEVECRPDMNDPTKFLFVVPQKDDPNTFMTTATGDEGNRMNSSYYNHERVLQVLENVFLYADSFR